MKFWNRLQFVGGWLCSIGWDRFGGAAIEHEAIKKTLVGTRHFMTDAYEKQNQWPKSPELEARKAAAEGILRASERPAASPRRTPTRERLAELSFANRMARTSGLSAGEPR